MRIAAVSVIAAALATACSPNAAPDLDTTVLAVEVTSCTANLSDRATAAVIGDGLALTVAHTFAEAAEVVVSTDEQRVPAELVYLDVDRDIALLAFGSGLRELTPLEIVDDGDDPANRGRMVGLEDGLVVIEPVELLRRTAVTLDGEGRRDGIEIGGTIERGDSGAPVVDDDGRLIGLVFAASRAQETGWAIAGSELVEVETLAGAPIPLTCP